MAENFLGEARRPSRTYCAFISYSHDDRAKVLRLQSRLERFRFPRQLARKLGYSRLRPVCVDRSDMRAAPHLDDAIKEALERSDYLIVACTPRTPASHWVGKEIEFFREIRGDQHILVALLEGDAPESFHPQLLQGPSEDHKQPLAADFQRGGDGHHFALLKLIASLSGVDLDDLVLRHKKRQRGFRLALISGAATASLLIGFLVYRTYQSGIAVQNERIFASHAMQRQLDELRKEVREGGTLNMAEAINRNVELFYQGQSADIGVPEIELGRARLLHAKAETDISGRDFDAAAGNARKAWQITSSLHAREPDDLKITFMHAQSAFWVGYAAWLQRDTPLAAAFFARYAQLADELAAASPNNSDYVLEQGYAYSNLGMIALREARDLGAAEGHFGSSQSAFREVSRRNPADLDTKFALADGDSWLADVALFRGDYQSAQQYRDEQRSALNDILRSEPQNRAYRLGFLASQIGQARLEAAKGNHRVALRLLRLAEAEAGELLAGDPQNPSLAERVRIIKLFQAKYELATGAADDLRRAEDHIADCNRDWVVTPDGELPVFCSFLKASLMLRKGRHAIAKDIMADPRLTPWISSPSLSPIWRIDFQEECRSLAAPLLCRMHSREAGPAKASAPARKE
ncbi:toll/interleukin-1 receptor domain-containing protein [Erythrobacter mangrovi]|uniref:TIR domain-containing protein n=1 Tax=Erythrobacter mangrovi TaxID=2739433 RepID=A0A7D4C6M5_9SPHN|nr:toll/interleukin-1 receptor domain-containing protein [Erythrobacter mangrovi]QKG72565.1 TIR domain-containing protein [Erythrobacter mangrovi]